MKPMIIKTIYALVALLVFIPVAVDASEIRLDASKGDVHVGEEFFVNVSLYSDETVNAVEGSVIFPDELLRIKEIRDGNSSINFWIEKPHQVFPGVIVYSGVTPGGFSGQNNMLFSIVFEAKKTGIASIFQEKSRVLENDGIGTGLTVTHRDAEISIQRGGGINNKEVNTDTEAPEVFNPIVAQIPSVFDGKYFLAFATQDKGSGIKRYDVREGRFGWWREVTSPYILAHQALDRDIYVRAIDNAGNERIVVVPASVHGTWLDQYELLVIFILMIIVVVLFKKYGHIL